jgi:hypothetical protein
MYTTMENKKMYIAPCILDHEKTKECITILKYDAILMVYLGGLFRI